MHDDVKKSLDEMTSEADNLLEKSAKAKAKVDGKGEKAEKSAKKKADMKKDVTSEKDTKVDHEANGDDVDTQDEEKEEEGKVDKSGKDCRKSEHAKKSISDDLKGNEALQKSMSGDNSAFLNLFAQFQAQSLDKLNDKIEKSMDANDEFAGTLAKSVTSLLKSNDQMFDVIKSQNEKVKSLEDIVDKMSHQPVARKSILNPVEKSFVSNNDSNDGKDSLNKSQVASILSDAVLKKSNVVNPVDVATFEDSGSLRPEVKTYVESKLSK